MTHNETNKGDRDPLTELFEGNALDVDSIMQDLTPIDRMTMLGINPNYKDDDEPIMASAEHSDEYEVVCENFDDGKMTWRNETKSPIKPPVSKTLSATELNRAECIYLTANNAALEAKRIASSNKVVDIKSVADLIKQAMLSNGPEDNTLDEKMNLYMNELDIYHKKTIKYIYEQKAKRSLILSERAAKQASMVVEGLDGSDNNVDLDESYAESAMWETERDALERCQATNIDSAGSSVAAKKVWSRWIEVLHDVRIYRPEKLMKRSELLEDLTIGPFDSPRSYHSGFERQMQTNEIVWYKIVNDCNKNTITRYENAGALLEVLEKNDTAVVEKRHTIVFMPMRIPKSQSLWPLRVDATACNSIDSSVSCNPESIDQPHAVNDVDLVDPDLLSKMVYARDSNNEIILIDGRPKLVLRISGQNNAKSTKIVRIQWIPIRLNESHWEWCYSRYMANNTMFEPSSMTPYLHKADKHDFASRTNGSDDMGSPLYNSQFTDSAIPLMSNGSMNFHGVDLSCFQNGLCKLVINESNDCTQENLLKCPVFFRSDIDAYNSANGNQDFRKYPKGVALGYVRRMMLYGNYLKSPMGGGKNQFIAVGANNVQAWGLDAMNKPTWNTIFRVHNVTASDDTTEEPYATLGDGYTYYQNHWITAVGDTINNIGTRGYGGDDKNNDEFGPSVFRGRPLFRHRGSQLNGVADSKGHSGSSSIKRSMTYNHDSVLRDIRLLEYNARNAGRGGGGTSSASSANFLYSQYWRNVMFKPRDLSCLQTLPAFGTKVYNGSMRKKENSKSDTIEQMPAYLNFDFKRNGGRSLTICNALDSRYKRIDYSAASKSRSHQIGAVSSKSTTNDELDRLRKVGPPKPHKKFRQDLNQRYPETVLCHKLDVKSRLLQMRAFLMKMSNTIRKSDEKANDSDEEDDMEDDELSAEENEDELDREEDELGGDTGSSKASSKKGKQKVSGSEFEPYRDFINQDGTPMKWTPRTKPKSKETHVVDEYDTINDWIAKFDKDESTRLMAPSTLQEAVGRYVNDNNREMLWFAKTSRDDGTRINQPLKTDAKHVQKADGVWFSCRFDSGVECGSGGLDSYCPMPLNTDVKTIADVFLARGVHDYVRAPGESMQDPRAGPPQWWKREQRMSMEELHKRMSMEELHKRMDDSQVWPADSGRNDKRGTKNWDVAPPKIKLPNIATCYLESTPRDEYTGGTVVFDDFKPYNASDVQKEDRGLPHRHDARMDLMPIYPQRLTDKAQDAVWKRWIVNELAHQNKCLEVSEPDDSMKATRLRSSHMGFLKDNAVTKTDTSRNDAMSTLVTPCYIVALEYNDFIFSQNRTDTEWTKYFEIHKVYFINCDMFNVKVEGDNRPFLVHNPSYIAADREAPPRQMGKWSTCDGPLESPTTNGVDALGRLQVTTKRNQVRYEHRLAARPRERMRQSWRRDRKEFGGVPPEKGVDPQDVLTKRVTAFEEAYAFHMEDVKRWPDLRKVERAIDRENIRLRYNSLRLIWNIGRLQRLYDFTELFKEDLQHANDLDEHARERMSAWETRLPLVIFVIDTLQHASLVRTGISFHSNMKRLLTLKNSQVERLLSARSDEMRTPFIDDLINFDCKWPSSNDVDRKMQVAASSITLMLQTGFKANEDMESHAVPMWRHVVSVANKLLASASFDSVSTESDAFDDFMSVDATVLRLMKSLSDEEKKRYTVDNEVLDLMYTRIFGIGNAITELQSMFHDSGTWSNHTMSRDELMKMPATLMVLACTVVVAQDGVPLYHPLQKRTLPFMHAIVDAWSDRLVQIHASERIDKEQLANTDHKALGPETLRKARRPVRSGQYDTTRDRFEDLVQYRNTIGFDKDKKLLYERDLIHTESLVKREWTTAMTRRRLFSVDPTQELQLSSMRIMLEETASAFASIFPKIMDTGSIAEKLWKMLLSNRDIHGFPVGMTMDEVQSMHDLASKTQLVTNTEGVVPFQITQALQLLANHEHVNDICSQLYTEQLELTRRNEEAKGKWLDIIIKTAQLCEYTQKRSHDEMLDTDDTSFENVRNKLQMLMHNNATDFVSMDCTVSSDEIAKRMGLKRANTQDNEKMSRVKRLMTYLNGKSSSEQLLAHDVKADEVHTVASHVTDVISERNKPKFTTQPELSTSASASAWTGIAKLPDDKIIQDLMGKVIPVNIWDSVVDKARTMLLRARQVELDTVEKIDNIARERGMLIDLYTFMLTLSPDLKDLNTTLSNLQINETAVLTEELYNDICKGRFSMPSNSVETPTIHKFSVFGWEGGYRRYVGGLLRPDASGGGWSLDMTPMTPRQFRMSLLAEDSYPDTPTNFEPSYTSVDTTVRDVCHNETVANIDHALVEMGAEKDNGMRTQLHEIIHMQSRNVSIPICSPFAFGFLETNDAPNAGA